PYYQEDRRRLQGTPDLYALEYSAALTNLTAVDAPMYSNWVGRVVENPACVKNEFAIDPTNAGDVHLMHDGIVDPTCEYIDSQLKIESCVPAGAIRRTDIVVTCPFVMYNGRAVVLP